MAVKRFLKWYFIAPAALIGFALFMALGGWVVMSLWNWLVPPLLGLPTITFWRALGLLALCRILFGGFGFGGGGGGGGGFGKNMTPEERDRFRERMRARVCGAPGSDQESDT
jgi:hypothetical protein